MSRTGMATIIIGAMITFAPLAHADRTQDECVDGFEQAQRLRLDGKYQEAREQLLVCSRPVCPKITQPDCAKWLLEVEARLPTVIISARDASGHDLDAVKVSLDGRQLTDKLDGRPVYINPGPHAFRYEIEGGQVVEERVVLSEGEKDRRIAVNFPKINTTTTTTPAAPDEPRSRSSIPKISWGLGAVSVVALTSFVGFGLAGSSAEECVPNCSRSGFEDFRRNYLIADISLGVALITGGLAVYFALTHRPSSVSTH